MMTLIQGFFQNQKKESAKKASTSSARVFFTERKSRLSKETASTKKSRFVGPSTLALLATLTLLTGAPLPAAAAETAAPATAATAQSVTPATQLVRDFYAQLVRVMKQGEALGFSGRYKQLAPVIQDAYHLPLMTRFAVGPSWIAASEDQRTQIIKAFTTFSIATYASRFTKYDGEQFDVIGEKPASGGGVIVETHLTPKDSEPITLNYVVRNDETGKPRIVDVLMDATISELATRRSEFAAIVKREGLSALIVTLDQKAKSMGPS